MNKLLANFLLLICYGCLLLPQTAHALRIKRADSLANANATDNSNSNSNSNSNNNNIDINSNSNLTESALPALALALGTVDKPQVKIMDTPKAALDATANATEIAAATATAAAAASAAATATATALAATASKAATKAVAEPERKQLEQLEEAQANELAAHMHRGKRRMSLVDDLPLLKPAHHPRHHNALGGVNGGGGGVGAGNAAPPYVYFNKMVSPDGKQELKEFQLLAPNVVIESVQHDMNYGPGGDLGGVLLLNADNNLNGHLHGLSKPKHHHKHKSSLALPPFLFLLQQMLQPNLNLDLEPQLQTQSQAQRNRLDTPLYQFLDSAVDNALRNNHEIYGHLINDRDIELGDKDKEKDKERDSSELMPLSKLEIAKDDKAKNAFELATSRKDDELVVSCPIHHDHHANNNGEIVDDDVLLVNECHIV